jgi:hypothetical protein
LAATSSPPSRAGIRWWTTRPVVSPQSVQRWPSLCRTHALVFLQAAVSREGREEPERRRRACSAHGSGRPQWQRRI